MTDYTALFQMEIPLIFGTIIGWIMSKVKS